MTLIKISRPSGGLKYHSTIYRIPDTVNCIQDTELLMERVNGLLLDPARSGN
jgi:hypothetical protein